MSPFGVYVHVPFCRERCDYCAFATYTDRDHLMERYADACVRELQRAFGAADLAPATSVFFGGGTPSRLHPETLCRILDAIPRAPGAEVTVECNPEDADDAHLGAYRRAGVTRVSFGLQSTQAHVLAGLGRRHVPDAAEAIAAAVHGAGFATWNLDLIFGARHRERRRLGRHARRRARARRTRRRTSAPTASPSSPARHWPRTRRAIPTRTSQARRYEHADAVLARRGLRLGGDLQLGPARPRVPAQPPLLGAGRLRRHRLGGALAPRRHALVERAHARPLRRRRRGAAARPRPAARSSRREQREFEALSLSLRTPRGVPWDCLERPEELDGPRRATRATGPCSRVRGRLLANEVSARIRSGILHR